MKSLFQFVAVLAILTPSLNSQAQFSGIVNFSTGVTSDDRRVWVWENGTLVRAAGTGYRVALYWGQQGTPEAGLIQAGNSASFLTGTAAGLILAGNRTLTPLPQNGGVATLQVRGWAVLSGVDNTYEAALLAVLNGNPEARVGVSAVFDHRTARFGDPTDPPIPFGGPVASGGNPDWHGLAIGIPEPSTITLAVVAGAALLLFRRRKTS